MELPSLLASPADDVASALPHAESAEKSILSSMMQDETGYYLEKAEDNGLAPEDFYNPAHGIIYRIVRELRKDQRPYSDLVTLNMTLRDRSMLERVGGPSELAAIYTWASTTAYFERHLDFVLARSLQRRVISEFTHGIGEMYAAEADDAESLFAARLNTATKILSHRPAQEMGNARELIEEAKKELEAKRNHTLKIPTPWEKMNRGLDGGIGRGEIMFLAARPSLGKTSMALNLMAHAAGRVNVPSLYISLESGRTRLMNRMVSTYSRVPLSNINRGELDMHQQPEVDEAMDAIKQWPIFMAKLRNPRHSDITRMIRTGVREHGIQLVFVDYLQKLLPSERVEQADMRLRIDTALDVICPMAEEHNIALVILVQLSREAEGKTAGQLHLGMLKDSGRIEQDGDVIMMLARSDKDEEASEGIAMIDLVAPKMRDGAPFGMGLTMLGNFVRFEQRSDWEPNR